MISFVPPDLSIINCFFFYNNSKVPLLYHTKHVSYPFIFKLVSSIWILASCLFLIKHIINEQTTMMLLNLVNDDEL